MKARSATERVIPVLRDDGTVYFHYAGRTSGERRGDWTLALLWLLVLAVIVAVPLWG